MRFVTILLILALCLAADPARGQMTEPGDDRMALARELVEATNTEDTAALRFLLKLLMTKESDELVDALVDGLDFESLGETLIPLYARHMSAAELRVAIDYYASPDSVTEARQAPAVPPEVMTALEAWLREKVPQVLDTLATQGIDSSIFDPYRLRQTIADMRDIGSALMSWLAIGSSLLGSARGLLRRGFDDALSVAARRRRGGILTCVELLSPP